MGNYKFEFPKNKKGEYGWRLRCLNNGKIVASGGQGFWKTVRSAKRAAENVVRIFRSGIPVL